MGVGSSAARNAIQADDAAELARLAQADISCIEETDSYGWTLLHLAVYKKSNACVSFILSTNRVPVNAISLGGMALQSEWRERGLTALHIAARQDNPAVVGLLITAGATVDVAREGGFTALMDAADGGHALCVATLLRAHASLDAVSSGGVSSLHLAIQHDHHEVVEQLVAAGANKERLDRLGKTPLSIAAALGHPASAAVLIRCGANANAVWGVESPLDSAVRGRHVDMVKILLDATNATLRDKAFRSVIQRQSASSGKVSEDIVKLFLARRGIVSRSTVETELEGCVGYANLGLAARDNCARDVTRAATDLQRCEAELTEVTQWWSRGADQQDPDERMAALQEKQDAVATARVQLFSVRSQHEASQATLARIRSMMSLLSEYLAWVDPPPHVVASNLIEPSRGNGASVLSADVDIDDSTSRPPTASSPSPSSSAAAAAAISSSSSPSQSSSSSARWPPPVPISAQPSPPPAAAVTAAPSAAPLDPSEDILSAALDAMSQLFFPRVAAAAVLPQPLAPPPAARITALSPVAGGTTPNSGSAGSGSPQDARLCIICEERERDTTLVPCGHVFCGSCAARIRSTHCSICRRRVETVMRVYF